MAIGLLAILAIGCSTTRTVYIGPECQPAPRPVVDLERRALWDSLAAKKDAGGTCTNEGCRMYRRVEDTIDALIDWGKENEAVLKEVC